MVRIVSLIASATEIVCALGFEEQLVGRSHECDFPPSVKHLPLCTEPRFDVLGSSRQIDTSVRALVSESTSVYRLHGDVLEELQPDVIVTQSQCEVCAVSVDEVERAIAGWAGPQPRIVTLKPDSLADVWQDMLRVAEALDALDRGSELVEGLKRRMAGIAERARCLSLRPSIVCLEWLDPLMAAGNWVPELVEMAGGVDLCGIAGKHPPWLIWDQLRQCDPEVIVALPCGLDLERTRTEMVARMGKPDWPDLRAVRAGRVYVTDGNQYFNRPGPRLVESLEILAEVLHPQTFHFGQEGRGWRNLRRSDG